MKKTTYFAKCSMCGDSHAIKAVPADVKAWQNGKLIQVAMPYLTVAERELLISGTCDSCFTNLFGLAE